jgi:hypothetical protein
LALPITSKGPDAALNSASSPTHVAASNRAGDAVTGVRVIQCQLEDRLVHSALPSPRRDGPSQHTHTAAWKCCSRYWLPLQVPAATRLQEHMPWCTMDVKRTCVLLTYLLTWLGCEENVCVTYLLTYMAMDVKRTCVLHGRSKNAQTGGGCHRADTQLCATTNSVTHGAVHPQHSRDRPALPGGFSHWPGRLRFNFRL